MAKNTSLGNQTQKIPRYQNPTRQKHGKPKSQLPVTPDPNSSKISRNNSRSISIRSISSQVKNRKKELTGKKIINLQDTSFTLSKAANKLNSALYAKKGDFKVKKAHGITPMSLKKGRYQDQSSIDPLN